MEDIQVIVAGITAEMKSFDARLKNLESMHEAINNLTISVTRLTERQTATEKMLASVAENVEEIKGKPAKRWDSVINTIIGILVGAFIGYLIHTTVS